MDINQLLLFIYFLRFYECGLCRVIFNNFEDFQAHGVFCEVASEEQIETTTEQIDNDLDAS